MTAFLARACPRIVTPRGNFHSCLITQTLGRMYTNNPLRDVLRELHNDFYLFRNINLMSIAYADAPRLRTD